MSEINLCWPDRQGINQCHTYLCDRRPTLQECPLSKGSSPSVIESTWVPCIQQAPFNCRDKSVKPHCTTQGARTHARPRAISSDNNGSYP